MEVIFRDKKVLQLSKALDEANLDIRKYRADIQVLEKQCSS
jgi:hypothetical protein